MHDAQYRFDCTGPSCVSFCKSTSNYSSDSLKEIYKGITKYVPNFFGGKEEENITIYMNDLKCKYFQRKIVDENLKNVLRIEVSREMQCKKFLSNKWEIKESQGMETIKN